MADNIQLNIGSGGDILAADEIAGVKHQRVKIQYGPDGSGTDVTSAAPLPVLASGTMSVNDGGGSLTVDGALDGAVYTGGAGVAAKLLLIGGADGSVPRPLAVNSSGHLLLSDAGGSVTVDGSVSITAALPAGGNSIGFVAISDMPPASATTDSIGAKLDTAGMMNGLTEVAVSHVAISAALSGDNTIIAAPAAGKKIRVLRFTLVASGAVSVRFESGAGGTALTGVMPLAANGVLSPEFCPYGVFDVAVATALNLELSGAVSVGGFLTYVVI